MTPRARRIVEKRQQRSAEVSERWWQELQRQNEESLRAQSQQPKPEPGPEPDDEARYRRAIHR